MTIALTVAPCPFVEGKIVITRLGTWRTLSFIARDPGLSPFNEPRLPNLS